MTDKRHLKLVKEITGNPAFNQAFDHMESFIIQKLKGLDWHDKDSRDYWNIMLHLCDVHKKMFTQTLREGKVIEFKEQEAASGARNIP